ncbi:MAG TPA: aspartate kinase [Myxococcales bacterium]|jgi:aspartate kinase|nr:aspartate kinase [Myxococcales bacterium]
MALIVQKYGGTSVGDADRIRNVARRALAARKAGHDVVVVVSAMAGETNRLLKLTSAVSKNPSEREQDVIVSTGEQVSVGLVALAIHELKGKARSFLGHQVKILTDSAFANARIRSIDDTRLRESLEKEEIAVVAGFQGMDEHGDITTLGRGGSDTTAVALAAALKADACEIYTDVDGVYTTDPNLCHRARKLSRISYEEMLELSSLGAKVLQIRSVEFAMKYKVPLWVKSSFTDDPGTLVCEEDKAMEDLVVSGIAVTRDEARFVARAVPDKPGVAAKIFKPLAEAGIVVDVIVQTPSHEGHTDLAFTVGRADVERTRELMKKTAKELKIGTVELEDGIAKVSIVGVGMRNHAGVASKMFEVLADEGVNIRVISTSEIKVSCLIDEKYAELAVRALHTAFGLDKPAA